MILTVLQADQIVRQAEQFYLRNQVSPTIKQRCMQTYKLLVKEGFDAVVTDDSVAVFNTDGSITQITRTTKWNVERRTINAEI